MKLNLIPFFLDFGKGSGLPIKKLNNEENDLATNVYCTNCKLNKHWLNEVINARLQVVPTQSCRTQCSSRTSLNITGKNQIHSRAMLYSGIYTRPTFSRSLFQSLLPDYVNNTSVNWSLPFTKTRASPNTLSLGNSRFVHSFSQRFVPNAVPLDESLYRDGIRTTCHVWENGTPARHGALLRERGALKALDENLILLGKKSANVFEPLKVFQFQFEKVITSFINNL